MGLVDGNDLDIWEGGRFDRNNAHSVSLLYRLLWIFTVLRGEGIYVSLNEAGRPYGVRSDIDVGKSGAGAGSTFSRISTVCYQWGRYLLWVLTGGRQGTPSAANPDAGEYASRHTVGTAADIDCNNYARLYEVAAQAGMRRTIPSEPWHLDTVADPSPDIDFSVFTPIVDEVFGRTPATLPALAEQEVKVTPGRPARKRVPMFLINFTSGVGAIVGITGKRKGLDKEDFDLMKRALYGRQFDGKTYDFEPDTFTDAQAERISQITKEVNS